MFGLTYSIDLQNYRRSFEIVIQDLEILIELERRGRQLILWEGKLSVGGLVADVVARHRLLLRLAM